MSLLNKDNKHRIDPQVVNAVNYWLDFKEWEFDRVAKWMVKGEMPPSGGFDTTGLMIPKGNDTFSCDEFFRDKLREACKEEGIQLVEFDCRSIRNYKDALWIFNTLANGDGKPKMVHIMHFTEIPDVPNRQTIGNVLVNSWKNPDICIGDVMLDTRPLQVYLSCEEGAESDFNPWDRTAGFGWYVYKKEEE